MLLDGFEWRQKSGYGVYWLATDRGQRSASSPQEGDVAEEKMTFLTEREAAEYLGVSLHTLRTMESEGSLIPFRTLGGHCGYSLRMLNEYLEKSYEPPHRRESESESKVPDVSLPPAPELQGQDSPIAAYLLFDETEQEPLEPEAQSVEPLPPQPPSPPPDPTPVDVLGLSIRPYNALRRSNITTIGHLAEMSDEEVRGVQNIGPKSLTEIKDKLKAYLAEHPLPDKAKESPLEPEPQAVELPPPLPPSPPLDPTPLDVLGLSIRPYNALRRKDITTIGQLARMLDEDIRSVRNIGPKSLTEIKDKLEAYLAEHPLPDEAKESPLEPEPQEVEPPPPPPPSPLPDPTPVDALGLSIRPHNALRRENITTIGQLARMSDEEIRDVRNIGPKSLAEIQEKLQAYLSANPALATRLAKALAQEEPPIGTPLSELDMPQEVQEELQAVGIRTMEEVVDYSEEELLLQLGVGYSDVLILKQGLSQRGLALATKPISQPLVESNTLTVLNQRRVPLGKIPIARLALPETWEETLRRTDFGNVQELAMASGHVLEVANFLRRPDIVSKIQSRLNRYLAWLIEQDDTAWADEVAGRGISPLYRLELAETSLETLIEELLSPLTSRQMQVILWRYGLDGEELNLGEVGDRLDLTRERVRQIQNKALDILKKSRRRPIIRLLSAFMLYLLEQAGGLMNEEQAGAALRRELVIGNVNPVGAARLVFTLDANVKRVRKAKAWGLRSYPLDEVEGMQAQLARVLEEEHAPLLTDEVITRFHRTQFYRDRRDTPTDSFVLACLRVHPDISIGEDNRCSLKRWKRGCTDEIILALRKIGESAHYTVIAEKTNALLEPEMRTSAHNIHAILGRRTDLFVRVGHGIFGLKEWGLSDDGSLANAAYRVLTEAGRPLHIEAITDRVLETWSVGRSSVQAAIHNDDRFYRAAPATFGLLEWEIERLDEAQPVLNICPPPLPDRWGERNTFFESVLVAREVLSERPITADFLEAMLKWVGTRMDKSERYLQNVLNAYYVVGLTPYTVYRRATDTPLHSTLPEIDDLQALRCFCLNCMMERLARMPEFMALLAARQPCTRTELRDWFYEPGAPLDDVKNRVRLLFNFGMLRVEKRGRYLLTPSGMQVTQELEAAGQLKYPASRSSWEQVSDSQPAWDIEFDMIDFELP